MRTPTILSNYVLRCSTIIGHTYSRIIKDEIRQSLIKIQIKKVVGPNCM